MTSPIGCSWNNGNFKSENIPNGKVTLSWDEVEGANSYNVYVSTKPSSHLINRYRIKNAANPITIVDLEPDITYYFVVTVVNDLGEWEISKEISYRGKDTEGFAEGFIKVENLFTSQDQLFAFQDRKIFFDTNSTKLLKSEIDKLNRFVQFIRGINGYQISLEGYTDSSGDIKNNRIISKNRAAAVKSYLVNKGIKAQDIDILGYGASNFILNNNSDEGKRMNRRVEIKVTIYKLKYGQ